MINVLMVNSDVPSAQTIVRCCCLTLVSFLSLIQSRQRMTQNVVERQKYSYRNKRTPYFCPLIFLFTVYLLFEGPRWQSGNTLSSHL